MMVFSAVYWGTFAHSTGSGLQSNTPARAASYGSNSSCSTLGQAKLDAGFHTVYATCFSAAAGVWGTACCQKRPSILEAVVVGPR